MSINGQGPAALGAPRESRCSCGHLLAILEKDGVEIKCRRCKRLMKIFLEDRGPSSPDPFRAERPDGCLCGKRGREK
ncbi:MAG: hypothetical protein A2902_02875 [Elusimicrobia bacterium RIFCSPLOWO2_01_FULL_64_13]|nr:MAG: hypothetical protein A2636_05075 [Elusimicrobia bacterium RIFCSPHIGHO2_01_FULL_64_10]OGR95659.1 MAG: hypothetical protein A2902_02875 [Elusimicrobia bacterium RIFCSPLOWO2_01_FULL_64_13]